MEKLKKLDYLVKHFIYEFLIEIIIYSYAVVTNNTEHTFYPVSPKGNTLHFDVSSSKL